MKLSKTLLTLTIIVSCVSMIQAQKIVQFSEYKIYKNEYGHTKIMTEPHTRNTDIGADASKYQKSSNVYGVLICYSINGEKKAKLLDMTYKLKNKGYYEYGLSYSSNSKVGSVSVTYFNMVDDPESKWPKKGDCF